MSKKDLFHAAQFKATRFNATAQDKADFANWLVKFLEDGCPKGRWAATKYRRLMYMFQFIAHYDVHGFWDARFSGSGERLETLTQISEDPCYGDPVDGWSDVSRVVRDHVRKTNLVAKYHLAHKQATEAAERAALAGLQAKYPDQR